MTYWRTLWGYFSDTETAEVRIDASTHSLQTVEYEHHEIHSGSHYFVIGYRTRKRDRKTAWKQTH